MDFENLQFRNDALRPSTVFETQLWKSPRNSFIVVVEEYKDGENRLGILICIFLHQVLDYHDVSMKAYNRISHST